jgi:hypothetical protein
MINPEPTGIDIRAKFYEWRNDRLSERDFKLALAEYSRMKRERERVECAAAPRGDCPVINAPGP